jgi:4-hydroxy-tetrahydrodipicolinate reductase
MADDEIRVLVAGAAGRMGSEVCRAVTRAEGMGVAVVADPSAGSATMQVESAGTFPAAAAVPAALELVQADVMVDFTHPEAVFENVLAALGAGVHCVVGTTGLTAQQLSEIGRKSDESGSNCLVAPNFAIGAVLMMALAERVAPWLPSAEVIELHHDKKADAPSGTAKMTAQRIAAARSESPVAPGKETETVEGARGAYVDGVPVHSVRLPGLVAHQEVVFGGPGQVLTIRHDSMDRTSFMPGVVLAVRRIASTPGLTVGLDALLDL